MKFFINVTFSKLSALLILALATMLDLTYDLKGELFRFSIYPVSALVLGKQAFDSIDKRQ